MAALRSVLLFVSLLLPVACGDDSEGGDDSAGGSSGTGGKSTGGSTGKGGAAGASTAAGSGGDETSGGTSASGGDGAGGADNQGGAESGGGAGGAGGESASLCEQGCVATLEADCANGPATQEQCVEDCEMLMVGACGSEYSELQACGEGEEITCGNGGIPVIEACADEQDAFIQCLN